MHTVFFPPRFPRLTGQDTLVWSDEFDFLDESLWTHWVSAWRGGNWEFQYYRHNDKNSYVDDGVLHIRYVPPLVTQQAELPVC